MFGVGSLEFIYFTQTWLQEPGAAPKSATSYPGFKILYLSYISINLYAALLLNPSFYAYFTN